MTPRAFEEITLARYDIRQKLAEFKINGYVIFEDLLPAEKVDELQAAFLPLLENVRAMTMGHETPGPQFEPRVVGDRPTGQGRLLNVNRYNVEVPWLPPFSDPEVYENPVLLEFLDRYWGTNDYLITLYSSNTPYPGSEYQPWHRDIPLVSPHVGLEVCPHFGVKIPLVDTVEENGSFEIIPGTQYLADPAMEDHYHEIVDNGDFCTRRLNMKKGSLWIQDPRPIHRGTPNRSDQPRPELVIAYSLPWFNPAQFIEMTQPQFDRLSERGKGLLRYCRIIA